MTWREEDIEDLVKHSFEYSQPDKNPCPFDWIKDPKYEMTGSAFWRVIKQVMLKGYGRNEKNCYYQIAWSEMCKIAPAEGGTLVQGRVIYNGIIAWNL